jgi:hypothetical protein
MGSTDHWHDDDAETWGGEEGEGIAEGGWGSGLYRLRRSPRPEEKKAAGL